MKEGLEPLTQWEKCRKNMQAAILFKHLQSYKCHKSTDRRLWQRDMEMVARCGETEFNLDGSDGDERVENAPTFLYMGQTLDQTDDYWPAVRQNIIRAMSVLGIIGKLLQQ